jgi:hypothetical protein
VPPGELAAIGPSLRQPLPRPLPADGIRVVTRDNGRYFDLMPSRFSSYLLPTLADCSLVRREARSAAGSLRFTGNAVELHEIADVVRLDDWRALFAGVGITIAGLGAAGSFTGDALSRLGALGSLGRAVVHITAPPTTSMPPKALPIRRLFPSEQPTLATAQAINLAPTVDAPLAADASVAEIASRITTLSDLSDDLLAELFKVERETFCRWRTGILTNPRVGNRQRLGLLLGLLQDLAGRQVNIKDWLLNFVTSQGLTPYQLLERGQIDEVAFLAASIGEPPVEPDAQVSSGEDPEPLMFGDDDVWELEPLGDDEQ